METGRPFFCGRDGIKKATLAEIERERRNGYSWYGTYGAAVLKDYERWFQRQVRRAEKRGVQFLQNLVDPVLGLLPEFRGHSVYWLYHDNYLVVKTLEKTDPSLSEKIRAAIEREGITGSGKIELLFDEAENPLPFRQHELIDVRNDGSGKLLRTEILKDTPLKGWEKYADLLLMSAFAKAPNQPEAAVKDFESARKMWDGIGLHDRVVDVANHYATYKLALYLLTDHRLGKRLPANERRRVAIKLLNRQSDSGGWITDYLADGTLRGKANVETSCLAILALRTLLDVEDRSK